MLADVLGLTEMITQESPLDTRPASPANTKHFYNICIMLDQRRRRWADVVQMLLKCTPANTKHFITFVQCTICTMGRRCRPTNVIKMFCVCWA